MGFTVCKKSLDLSKLKLPRNKGEEVEEAWGRATEKNPSPRTDRHDRQKYDYTDLNGRTIESVQGLRKCDIHLSLLDYSTRQTTAKLLAKKGKMVASNSKNTSNIISINKIYIYSQLI